MTKAPSPFLPDTKIQYAWDSTSLGFLKTCPRLYQYVMIDGWTEGRDAMSPHLRFGIELHSAFQEYSRWRAQGFDHERSLREVLTHILRTSADFDPDQTTKAGKYKNRHSLIRTIIYYLDDHAEDPAATHILSNGKPAVELSFRFELDWGPSTAKGSQPYLLSGHLDRVVDFNGDLFVMDHKTTTSTPGPYYFDGYSPNNQMTLYSLAGQVVMNAPIKGVIINAVQLLVDNNAFVRGMTFRTKGQINEWLADLRYWFALAEQFAIANHWPMNDTACDKFGGCKFRSVCSKDPAVRHAYLKANHTQLAPEERWNPLKSR